MTLDEILAYTDMDEREKEEVRSDTRLGRLRAFGYFGIDGRGRAALVRFRPCGVTNGVRWAKVEGL